VRSLRVTKEYAEPETIDVTERAAALAEKSGSLTQLIQYDGYESYHRAFMSGELHSAMMLADQYSTLPFSLRLHPRGVGAGELF
jgi:hypothetical protein